jgi:hypothetical protein
MVVSIYLGFDRRDFALEALPRLACEDLWVMYSLKGRGVTSLSSYLRVTTAGGSAMGMRRADR